MPGVPECIKQWTKLGASLHEAHIKHRSITLCWLDLANACGSVHHYLIHFGLQHYNAPTKLRNLVTDIYYSLQALVTFSDWTSQPIPMKTSLCQGDPLKLWYVPRQTPWINASPGLQIPRNSKNHPPSQVCRWYLPHRWWTWVLLEVAKAHRKVARLEWNEEKYPNATA